MYKYIFQASEMLRVIQLNTVEDTNVNDKREWDQAVRFLETAVKEKLQNTEQVLKEMLGPGRKERWLYWQSQNDEQRRRSAVKNELDKILYADKVTRKLCTLLDYRKLNDLHS